MVARLDSTVPSSNPSGVVTLTTDFGLQDHYVGAMKGVILSIFPGAQVADISHGVQPYAIAQGAYFLGQSFRYFPPGTVHVAVVDPGVGTSRRPLAVAADGHYFVAPDNGLLPLALEGLEAEALEIDAERWGLERQSATFHGRDLFAPAAAWLAGGKPFSSMGRAVRDWVELPRPEVDSGVTVGRVLNVDHFGNIVTSLKPAQLPEKFELQVGTLSTRRLCSSYEQAPAGEAFAIVGSAGLIELSIRQDSAASRAGLRIGDPVMAHPLIPRAPGS